MEPSSQLQLGVMVVSETVLILMSGSLIGRGARTTTRLGSVRLGAARPKHELGPTHLRTATM